MKTTWHNLFQHLQEVDRAPTLAASPSPRRERDEAGRDRKAGPEFSQPPGLIFKFLLLPLVSYLSLLYALGAQARRALYAQGWLKVKRLPGPVISVGNLTVGGTGKTPITACLARLLQGQGKKVAILSRGYGGTAKNVTRISDGRQIYKKPPDAGEEAYWLARELPGAAVYTAPARDAAGLAAWQEARPDIFVLDDGFQHFQLHRDLDVVLLDAESPFGNGFLLPRGPLREPLTALNAAQVLILTRFKNGRHQDRREFIQEKFPGKTVLTADILPTRAWEFPGDREIPLEGLQNRKLFSFSGLARPRVFADTLGDLGVELAGYRDFPDHHPFQIKELEKLVKEAAALEAEGLITTAKDWARLGEEWPYPLPLFVLEVAARLEEGGGERILEELAQVTEGNHGLVNNVDWGEQRDPVTPQVQDSSRPAAAQNDKIIKTQPLPQEVRQRLRQLPVRGKFAGDPAAVQKILVRVPNWVGDAVMSLPTLSGLHQLFPRAELTVLAAARVAPLFPGQPGVAEVVVYPGGGEKWRTLWRLRRGRTSNSKEKTENRKPSFDLGLALPNSWEAALGLWLAGARVRVGYNTDARGPLLNVAVANPRGLAGLHTVFYLLGVLQGLGGLEAFSPPRLYLLEEEIQAGAALLKSRQPEGPWVGLSPGAAYGPAKRWPPERCAALGAALQDKFNARLVLLGGPEDREAGEQVQARLPGVLNLVGRTRLRQALGVLTHLKLLVTNDSGLMHAAAALGTPLVAIFGSTDPVATGPFTPRATVLRHPLPCGPCFQRTCDLDYHCLLDISVEEATDAARVWLQEGL